MKMHTNKFLQFIIVSTHKYMYTTQTLHMSSICHEDFTRGLCWPSSLLISMNVHSITPKTKDYKQCIMYFKPLSYRLKTRYIYTFVFSKLSTRNMTLHIHVHIVLCHEWKKNPAAFQFEKGRYPSLNFKTTSNFINAVSHLFPMHRSLTEILTSALWQFFQLVVVE